MKNMFLKSSIALALMASFGFAAPEKKDEDFAPKYKNRISALQNTLSFDRSGDNDMHFGFESYIANAWRDVNDTTHVGVIEARIGYTVASDSSMRVTPVLGVSVFRDMEQSNLYVSISQIEKPFATTTSPVRVIHPYRVHGMVGLMGEYDACKAISVGLHLKGLVGKVTGSAESGMKELSYGLHAALPVTFRFGTDYHWDLRMEPFAIVLRDAAKYLGGRAAVGYRF